MAFCTITDLANFLQVTIDAGNAAATRAIAEATAAIVTYCGQTIEKVEDDEYTFDVPAGQSKLFLPELPVIAVSEVVEDGEELDADDHYKLGNHGILYRVNAKWVSGIQIVTVTYDHGYATIPEIVKDVCVRAAARSYQSGLRAAALAGVPGVSATSLGDYSVSYSGEQAGGGAGVDGGTLGASAAPILLPSEKRMLDHYKLRSA